MEEKRDQEFIGCMEEGNSGEAMDGIEGSDQNRKEVLEAIQAGESALKSLEKAYDYLGSAGGWGLFDMFAGGLLSSMVKHSKLDDAKEEMESAKRKLAVFRKELEDVSSFPDFQINVDGFLRFADIFLDNFFVDWAVQSQISKAEEDVYAAMTKVRGVLGKLRQML